MQANDFATEVFNLNPAKPGNLDTVAKQKGLAVRTTAPFGGRIRAGGICGAPELHQGRVPIRRPTNRSPGRSPSTDAVYVIALAKQLPSEIPPLDDIRDRVTQDFQIARSHVARATRRDQFRRQRWQSRWPPGSIFASICAADGLEAQTLPPFSLSTQKLPELDARLGFDQLKQVALSTTPGHVSGFEPTDDGGFIVYVQSQLPLDPTAMNAELPQFTAALRRARENEAFNEWLSLEANHELQNTPLFRREAAAGVPK